MAEHTDDVDAPSPSKSLFILQALIVLTTTLAIGEPAKRKMDKSGDVGQTRDSNGSQGK